ncbi:hypothetical protein SAMN05661012_06646 [Chitinophaga sancti]|uniref:Uncharacterized protein n=1 Tax=Chitinophaga sancti TaxID=1004 RepID=A0A1K1T213_9BACT|nr:hypothetical protein SAMN05661012_06646 [Chitinophaga sancti]
MVKLGQLFMNTQKLLCYEEEVEGNNLRYHSIDNIYSQIDIEINLIYIERHYCEMATTL